MKCSTCPVEGPCYADHPSRRRMCQLIEGGNEAYRRLVVERSGDPGYPGPYSPAPGSKLKANAALNARVRSCEHRECRGCGSAWCRKYAAFKTTADCHQCPDLPAASSPTVSIVVAARNCGRWLEETLRSAVDQRAVEVIYVDDASDDDSVMVAQSIPGVTILASDHRDGVCAARNLGDAIARGEWIIHLDGDDVLPPGFLAAHIDAHNTDPDADLIYSGADFFGTRAGGWEARTWDQATLANGNHIHTSAMVRAKALRAVGGWRENIGTAWDWDLWLRMAAAGRRGVPVSSTKLRYRQHDANITDAQGLRGRDTGRRLHLMMRLAHSRPVVACVMSDRIPDLWPEWFVNVGECIRRFQRWARELSPFPPFGRALEVPVDLAILYTGDRNRLADVQWMAGNLPGVADISIMGQYWRPAPEPDRADSVSTFLAAAYNRLMSLPNDLVWFVEDDVIPPADALEQLARAAFGGDTIEPVVAGWYRSRHGTDPHIIANRRDHAGRMRPVTEIGRGLNPVDLTGTGCLLVYKPLASHPFASHWNGVAAHDFAWCSQLSRPVQIVGEVECRHYKTAGAYV
jgi:hypothetical protein